MATTLLGLPTLMSWGSTTLALNGAGIGAAMIFNAPKTGTIDAICVGFSAITSPPTYRVGLEGTVATRSPDGTYKNSGNAYVDVTPTVGMSWRTLGATASVTAGDSLSAAIRYQTGTIGASNTATVYTGASSASMITGTPFYSTLSGGTWTFNNNPHPQIAVRYTDGTVVGFAASGGAFSGWGNGTTPLLRGNLWVPPVDVEVCGIRALARINTAGGNVKFSLYDGTTSLVSRTITQALDESGANPDYLEMYFAPQAISAATNLRVVAEPTTANIITNFSLWDFIDSTARDGFWASLIAGTTANTAGGAWTDTSLRMYSILPIISKVQSSSASFVIGG